jgi:hypothetical protein
VNEADPTSDALPTTAVIGAPILFIPWLLGLGDVVFPFSLLLALICVGSVIIMGIFAFMLFRQRARSAAHRFAFYVCLAFFCCVGLVLLLSSSPVHYRFTISAKAQTR